ncbi:hypothetical protein [Mycetocola sp. 2940]|uniref:lipopolysaccharide biosynthesis protein n=1 Tax=Mycetocola sp. 2940 TaxID=3156452 RepID=UPI003395508D
MSADEAVAGSKPSGLTPILVATAVAGATGYAIQFLVPLSVTPEQYLRFSVFWAALYLVVSGLSGIQQEISRATSPLRAAPRAGSANARRFSGVAVLLVLVCAPVSALLWGSTVFPENTWPLVAALTLGSAGYVLVAVLSGLLYGLSEWKVIAFQTMLDAGIRLVLVAAGVALGADVDALVWAVVLPFPLTAACVWLVVSRRVRGRYTVDVSVGRLGWNSARTVVGATATGVLISGFPLLLNATSKDESQAAVGVLVLAITLTRAPLVIPLLALQSFLTVYFRDRNAHAWRLVWLALAGTAGITAVASVLAFLLGPVLFLTLFGADYAIDAPAMAAVVASAGLTAALCVSGPAVLARGNHAIFVYGWVASAVVLIGVLLLPLDLVPRTVGALVIGPLVGLAIHLLGLAFVVRSLPVADRGAQTPQ